MIRRVTVRVSCFCDINSSFPNPVINDGHTQQKDHLQGKNKSYKIIYLLLVKTNNKFTTMDALHNFYSAAKGFLECTS